MSAPASQQPGRVLIGQLAAHDSAIVPEPNASNHSDRSFAPTLPLQS
jgi:hypothetical protein